MCKKKKERKKERIRTLGKSERVRERGREGEKGTKGKVERV